MKFVNKPLCLFFTIAAITAGIIAYMLYQDHLFTQSVSGFGIKNISKVYVINLDRSVERRKRYEGYLSENFGETFLGKNIASIRFRGSDGKNDLIFIDEKHPRKRIKAVDITSGKYKLKDYTTYKIFDKNDPDVFIRYIFMPELSKRSPSIGEFGCTLAHLRAINDIAKNNLPAGLIFEDDFVVFDKKDKFYHNFQDQLNNTPKAFGLVKFDNYNGRTKKRVGVAEKRSKFLLGKNKYFVNLKFFTKYVGCTTAYLVSYQGAVKIVDFVKNNVIIGNDIVADTLLLNILPKYQGFDNFYITKKPLFYQFDRTADGSTTTSSVIREIDNDSNVSGLTRDKKA